MEGDVRRMRGEQQHKWKLEEYNLLEVQWMKESRILFALSEGAYDP